MQRKSYCKIYDMTHQGRRKGTLMGIVYREKNGEQIEATAESASIKDIHESARKIAKEHNLGPVEFSQRADKM